MKIFFYFYVRFTQLNNLFIVTTHFILFDVYYTCLQIYAQILFPKTEIISSCSFEYLFRVVVHVN